MTKRTGARAAPAPSPAPALPADLPPSFRPAVYRFALTLNTLLDQAESPRSGGRLNDAARSLAQLPAKHARDQVLLECVDDLLGELEAALNGRPAKLSARARAEVHEQAAALAAAAFLLQEDGRLDARATAGAWDREDVIVGGTELEEEEEPDDGFEVLDDLDDDDLLYLPEDVEDVRGDHER